MTYAADSFAEIPDAAQNQCSTLILSHDLTPMLKCLPGSATSAADISFHIIFYILAFSIHASVTWMSWKADEHETTPLNLFFAAESL